MDTWQIDRRLMMLKAVIFLLFLALAGAFFFVQAVQGQHFWLMSQYNRIRRVWIPAPRGKVHDRNGMIMTDNRPSFDIALDYRVMKEREEAVGLVSHILEAPRSEVEKKILEYRGPAYLPIPVKRDVDLKTLTKVEEERLGNPLIVVGVNPVRNYILGERACSILGYVGAINREEYDQLKDRGYHWLDVIGKAGIEASCESFLKGESGGMQVEVDHRGRRERVLSIKKPVPGRDIYLTIDMKVQEALEEILADRKGAAIVMNPNTGEILGAVSRPGFDPNVFISPESRQEVLRLLKEPARPLVNKCFQGVYGPGSVFKLVVAAALLRSGSWLAGAAVECNGSYQVGGRVFRCWRDSGHGTVDLAKAIKVSCNVFFYHFSQRLGPGRISEVAGEFGLGRPTGFDSGAEGKGLVPSPSWKKEKLGEPWYGGDTANFAVGQGFVSVTPLQMAVLVSAIANGGTLFKPYLLKRVVLPEGRTLVEVAPQAMERVELPSGILSQIREAMREVVEDRGGTGRLARIEEVELAGKTGTVQVRKGADFVKNGWFVAFGPYEKPEKVLVLILEGIDSAGRDVAPVAKQILERCFRK